jgi:hypothetical protein
MPDARRLDRELERQRELAAVVTLQLADRVLRRVFDDPSPLRHPMPISPCDVVRHQPS